MVDTKTYKNDKLTRVLSIDGGGIRGIVPGQILVYLENKLRQMENDNSVKISDYFDIIAGTSTGGILTCIYLVPGVDGRPLFDASDAVDLYMSKGNDIFKRTLWDRVKSMFGVISEKYDKRGIETTLDDYMQNLTLKDLLKPSLITSYDIENRKGHFFKSHRAKTDKRYNFLLKDAARSTSAAPTYFEVSRIQSESGEMYSLIDGGVFVNNPSLCAYAEARKTVFDEHRIKPTASDMMILSIGTGSRNKPYRYDKVKKWGAVKWIAPLIDIMMSGVADAVDYQLRQIYDAVGKPEQYIRISPDLRDANTEMDDVSDDNLHKLLKAGELSAIDNDDVLSRVADMLISNK